MNYFSKMVTTKVADTDFRPAIVIELYCANCYGHSPRRISIIRARYFGHVVFSYEPDQAREIQDRQFEDGHVKHVIEHANKIYIY